MFPKLPDPINLLVKLLETFRKVIEKKLTAQTVNQMVIVLVIAAVLLSSQLFIALLVIKILGL